MANQQTSGSGPAKKKVLIVDDEPDSIDFVEAVLASDTIEVISAPDGVAGLAKARAEKPDLVILDVQMPNKDGFEVFAELRQDEKTAGIPVVMLTGVGARTGLHFSKKDMGDFLGSEPDAYVEKPIEPEKLEQTVASLLGD